jgi:hypothetical protein
MIATLCFPGLCALHVSEDDKYHVSGADESR